MVWGPEINLSFVMGQLSVKYPTIISGHKNDLLSGLGDETCVSW